MLARPDALEQLLESAVGSLEQLASAGGELLDRAGAVLEKTAELARGGAEWIRENPEAVRAGCEMVAFVAIAATRPELLGTLLERAPIDRWAAALGSAA